MRYVASITDFFKSPKWLMNSLFGALCIFIPILGPLLLMGWAITGFWGRDDEAPESFPEFDFNKFSIYLDRGLWPFLAMMVASTVLSLVVMAIAFVGFLIIAALAAALGEDIGPWVAGVGMLVLMAFMLVLMLITGLVLKPISLHATISMDFGRAFQVKFIKDFIRLTWKECILSTLFLLFANMVLSMLGSLIFCVGMYLTMAAIMFAMEHLDKQLYGLYLQRGGDPLEISPKLLGHQPLLPPV